MFFFTIVEKVFLVSIDRLSEDPASSYSFSTVRLIQVSIEQMEQFNAKIGSQERSISTFCSASEKWQRVRRQSFI